MARERHRSTANGLAGAARVLVWATLRTKRHGRNEERVNENDAVTAEIRERIRRETTSDPDTFRANPVREAMRRYHFDPVLHARAHHAAGIVEAGIPSVTTPDGEVLRAVIADRDSLLLAAAVALILAEIEPQ